MAMNSLLNNVKQRVKSFYNEFFYEGREAPAPQMQQESPAPYGPGGQPAGRSYQPNESAPQPGYGAAFPQAQPQPQQPQGHRVRRALRNQQEKVVDFSSYQQQVQQQYAAQQYGAPQQYAPQQQYAAPQAAYQQQPQNPPQAAPQQAMESRPAGSTICARIINARGMADCRSAITLLRKGDSVLIVLENVTDPTEMRRLVDTLSGACYSLTATITKVSRYGVYLLAPQPVAVFADQATNMMNSVSGRQPRSSQGAMAHQRMYDPPQPGYQQQAYQQQAYQQQAYQQPQQAYQAAQGAYQPYPPQQAAYQGMQGQAPYPPQAYSGDPQPSGGFTQRSAMPEEAPRDFYQRPAPQASQAPAFSAQQAGYGYAPDDTRAVDQ